MMAQRLLVVLFVILSTVSCFFIYPRSNRYGIITPAYGTAPPVEVKRYDRNCFFSPVQCMLTYNDDAGFPLIVTRKGKRDGFDNNNNLQ